MVYKLWKFISHSSGSWEVHDQVAGRFSAWWGKASSLTVSFHCNLTWWKMRGSSLRPLLQGHNLIHDLFTSQRPHLKMSSHWGLFSTHGFWEDTNIQSVSCNHFYLHWKLFSKLILNSRSLALQFFLPGILISSHGGLVLDIPILDQMSLS